MAEEETPAEAEPEPAESEPELELAGMSEQEKKLMGAMGKRVD